MNAWLKGPPMPLKIKVSETKVVFQNLFICAVVFYTVYYLVYVVSFIALRLDDFDERGPFDFKTNPSWLNKKYLVNIISVEATFVICGLLFVFVVEEWIWDYACTITVFHVIITTMGFHSTAKQTKSYKAFNYISVFLVMMEFPFIWHWWISLGIGLFSMICGGQILAYIFYKDNFIYPVLNDF